MLSCLIAIDEEDRPPTGSEIDLVDLIRERREASVSRDALWAQLISLGYVPLGLNRVIEAHKATLRAAK